AQQGEEREAAPDRVAPRVDGAQLRTDVEVDAARLDGAGSAGGDVDRFGQLRLGHPELRGAAAHGQATVGLGADVRIQPEEDVEWPREGSTSCEAGERPGFGGRLDGEPAHRPADARRADDGSQVVV